MRTQTINLYQFSELSKEAKEKALKHFADINIDHDWWDSIKDDLKDVGLELKAFDLYHNHIQIGVNDNIESIIKKIKENHGESCNTYKTACTYEKELVTTKDDDEKYEEAQINFISSIEKIYLKQLKEEEEYLQSEEAIIETIECNEYEFTADGTFYTLT